MARMETQRLERDQTMFVLLATDAAILMGIATISIVHS